MTERSRFLIVQIGVVAIVLFLFISPWSPLVPPASLCGWRKCQTRNSTATGRRIPPTEITSDEDSRMRSVGIAILNEHLEYPDGLDATNVKRLEMEQAWWGFVDQCTVTAYVRRMTVEQEVPCWDDSLSEPYPDS